MTPVLTILSAFQQLQAKVYPNVCILVKFALLEGGRSDSFRRCKSPHKSTLFLSKAEHLWQALLGGAFFSRLCFEDGHRDSQV